MGRQEQTEEVQQKVVAAAYRLFLEKGYAQTTLREISAAAGVSYGSIYHHFADKEGIFQELVLDGFEKTQQAADRQLKGQQSPYLRLGLKWAGLIQAASADARIAELLSIAYRSRKIAESLMAAATARHREWLQPELPDWSDDQFFGATLVLTGAVLSMVDEKLNLDRLTAEGRIRAVLSAALPGFGASPEMTSRVLQKVLRSAVTLAKAAVEDAKPRQKAS